MKSKTSAVGSKSLLARTVAFIILYELLFFYSVEDYSRTLNVAKNIF